MKILISCLAFVLAVTGAHAYEGFFIGSKLGGNLLRSHHTYSSSDETYIGEDSVSITKFGFPYLFYLGYAHLTSGSNVLIGGQIGIGGVGGKKSSPITLTDSTTEDSVTAAEFGFSQKLSFSLALMLGKAMNPKTTYYVLLGWDYGTFHLRYNSSLPQFYNSVTKSASTFFPGFGMQYRFTKNFGLGFEYQFLGIYRKLVVQTSSLYSSIRPISHRLYLTLTFSTG